MLFKELINKCDAIVLPAFIASEQDLSKIEYFQTINSNFNSLFSNTVICVNYKSLEIREKLMLDVENIFNKYFNNIHFIHNKVNYENVRSLCIQEQTLIEYCQQQNYKMICKTMDHVVILEEAFELELEEGNDFYYTNGLGYGGCQKWGFDVEKIFENTYFPQTNFYFIDVSKLDYLYDLKEVERKHLEWENDNSVCPNGYFVTCEKETGISVNRNNLKKQDIIPKEKFKELIQKVIAFNLHDPSFKNLSTCGILHYQYPNQEVRKLI